MMPELPDLDENDMPDIRSLTPEELEKVPFDKVKWMCCISHCGGTTVLKDYGISPRYIWRKRWLNLDWNTFMCGKHVKRYRKRYGGKQSNWWNMIPDHYFRPGQGIDHLKNNK